MCSKRELTQDSAPLQDFFVELFVFFRITDILSGMARGIDAIGHHGALASNGRAIGVLGTGIDATLVLSGTREICDQAIQSCSTTERTTGTPAQESAPARARRGKRLAPSRLERMRVITYLSTINILYGPRGVFGQHRSEDSHENIHVAFGNDQRRPKLDDIVKRPVRSSEDTAFAKPVYHVCRLRG
jgi:DNA recombination-mediator protein A